MNKTHKTIIELANSEMPSTKIAEQVGRSKALVGQVIANNPELIRRTCPKCAQTKTLNGFSKKQDGKYGRRRECTACRGNVREAFKLNFSCVPWNKNYQELRADS